MSGPRRTADLLSRRVSRREALRFALAGGVGLTLASCGGDGEKPVPTATEPAGPPAPVPTATARPTTGWRRLEPSGAAPPGTRDHTLSYDARQGKVYLFGGRTDGTSLAQLWAYDLAGATWEELSPGGEAPPARFGHNAAFDPAARRLVVFGGQSEEDFFDDLWAYEVAENAWRSLGAGDGPSARYGAGGALDSAGGVFYVTHGFTFQGRFDDTWRLDLTGDAWRDVSPVAGRPLRRCLLRAVWEAGARALLLFGGQSNEAPFHDDFWRFDTAAGTWAEVRADPRPSARNFYAADYDFAGGRLVLFGGRTADGDVDDVWTFDSDSESWSRMSLGPGPSARSGHDAVYLPDQRSLLVFGGTDATGDLNDLWELGLA